MFSVWLLCMDSSVREQTPIWWAVSGNHRFSVSLCVCVVVCTRGSAEATKLSKTKHKPQAISVSLCLSVNCICRSHSSVCSWRGFCTVWGFDAHLKPAERGSVVRSHLKQGVWIQSVQCPVGATLTQFLFSFTVQVNSADEEHDLI